jgi:hypothetical protein
LRQEKKIPDPSIQKIAWTNWLRVSPRQAALLKTVMSRPLSQIQHSAVRKALASGAAALFHLPRDRLETEGER